MGIYRNPVFTANGKRFAKKEQNKSGIKTHICFTSPFDFLTYYAACFFIVLNYKLQVVYVLNGLLVFAEQIITGITAERIEARFHILFVFDVFFVTLFQFSSPYLQFLVPQSVVLREF